MKNIAIKATLICGTLDITYAIVMAILHDGSALNVLLSVASGPFGAPAKSWGWTGALLGLLVHFSIMLVMVGSFLGLRKKFPLIASLSPFLSGAIYGFLLYVVMYWIVLSLRWPNIFPQTDIEHIVRALIPHIFLVGIPLAFMAKSKKREI